MLGVYKHYYKNDFQQQDHFYYRGDWIKSHSTDASSRATRYPAASTIDSIETAAIQPPLPLTP